MWPCSRNSTFQSVSPCRIRQRRVVFSGVVICNHSFPALLEELLTRPGDFSNVCMWAIASTILILCFSVAITASALSEKHKPDAEQEKG